MVSIFDFGQDTVFQGMDEVQRRQAISQGLLDFGSQMLGASSARGQAPSFGQGLAAGARGFGRSIQQSQQQLSRQQMMDLRRQQVEAQLQQQQREQEQQQRQQEALSQLAGSAGDPRAAMFAQAFPEQAAQGLMPPSLMSPSDRYVNVGGNLLDITAQGGPRVAYSAPRAPKSLSASDLVEINTPEGPRLVPASQAVGMEPYMEGDQTQRQRRVSSLSGRFRETGMSETEARRKAEDVVDGYVDIEIVPQTGRARLINKITNTVEEVPIGQMQPQDGGVDVGQVSQVQESGLPSEPLYEAAEEGTGLWPTAQEIWSETAGQIRGVPIAEEAIQARSNLRTATGELVRAMSVNPRFPVAEMERIREEVNISPSALDSPRAMQSRMRELERSLESRQQQAERDAEDPSLPEDTRSAQAQNASAIRNFRARLGVPEGGEQGAGRFQNMSRQQLDQLDASQLSPEELEAAARRYDQLDAGQ